MSHSSSSPPHAAAATHPPHTPIADGAVAERSMQSDTPIPTANAVRRVTLDRIPADVLRAMAEQLCTDADLMRLSRCNRNLLRVLANCRLWKCVDEVGLRLAEAAAARSAALRARATATATANSVHLSASAPSDGNSECNAAPTSSASSSAAVAAASESALEAESESEAAATAAIKPREAQSEAASRSSSSGEEAISKRAEADALESSRSHVASLSTSDMRVGRPVRMQIARGDADLRPLASYNTLRSLRIDFDGNSLQRSVPLFAGNLSANLPPTLQELEIHRTICVRDSVHELRLPPSLTHLRMPFLLRLQPGDDVPPLSSPSLCPLPLHLPSLTHLSLEWCTAWGRSAFPPSLLSLRIESLDTNDVLPSWPPMPETLQSLQFGAYVFRLEGLQLPPSLTLLDLAESSGNQRLESLQLPPGLKSLRLGRYFGQSIEHVRLPPALTELHFHAASGVFDQPIERLQLPPTLTSLRLSYAFNQPCAALCLPESLTELHFGHAFNSSLPLHLPDSIRSLDLGGKWQRRMRTKVAEPPLRLPAAITSFTPPEYFPLPPRTHLLFAPNSRLTHLGLASSVGSLFGLRWPSSLRSLHLDCRHWLPTALTQVTWPPVLQHLRLELRIADEQLLADWTPPPSVTHLHLSHMPKQDAISSIRWPPRMQKLSFHYCNLKDLNSSFSWPSSVASSLTSLSMSDGASDSKSPSRDFGAADVPPGFLPHGLRSLQLSPGWWGPLFESLPLPSTLTSLEIGTQEQGSCFRASLVELLRDLPPGLQSLAMHQGRMMQPILPSDAEESSGKPASSSSSPQPRPQLPPSLRHLRLSFPRHLTVEGWSPLLDERPDCSVTFDD